MRPDPIPYPTTTKMSARFLASLVVIAAIGNPRSSLGQATTQPLTYDVVIRNGRVLDGAGNPWILADVAIKDGRFAKIGRVPERGTTEIDARGKYVSPGWTRAPFSVPSRINRAASFPGTGWPKTSCAWA